ncbi:MAG: hypothetical protein KDI19_05500 [Pseudomonadales bacterium]|nr:hypothetical protein [Pseudomonadales bacterium]
MNTEAMFNVANKLLKLKDKDELIDLLRDELDDESLVSTVDEWKQKSPQEIIDGLEADLINRLKSKLPRKYHFLLNPVSSVNDKTLDLAHLAKSTRGSAGLTIGAAASSAIEFDGVIDDDLSKRLKQTLPTGTSMFTVSAIGKIGVSASGQGGTSLVSLSGSLASDYRQEFTVGFVRDRDQLVLADLLRIQDYFINPADLSTVMASFKDQRGAIICRRFHGTVTLGIEVGIDKDLTAQLKELVSNPGITPKAGAQASFNVSFKDDDEFVLSVERDTASSVWVRLDRQREQSRTRTFKAGLNIELKGLKDQLINRITELLPSENGVSEAIAKLDKFIDDASAEHLSEKLKTELTDHWPDHSSAFDVLLGYKTTQDVADSIVSDLSESIAEKINARANVLVDDASVKANEIAREIVFQLGLGDDASRSIQDYISKAAKGALERVQKEVDARIKTADGQVKKQMIEILQPFANLSEKVRDAVTELSSTAQTNLEKVKTGIEDLYSRYTHFRQKLLDAVQEKVAEQATLALTRTTTDTRTATSLIAFRITDAGAEGVEALYRSVWASRLDDFPALAARLRASGGIDNLEGEYASTLERKETLSVSLNLFGVKLGNQVMFTNAAKVKFDTNGKLLVAATDAEYRTQRSLGNESQIVDADWSINYLDDAPDASPPVTLTLGITDEAFDEDDLTTCFTGLTKLGCVKPDTGAAVKAALFDRLRNPGSASVTFVVSLNWQTLQDLLGTSLALDRGVAIKPSGDERAGIWHGGLIARKIFDYSVQSHGSAYFESMTRFAARNDFDPGDLLFTLGQCRTWQDAKAKFPPAVSQHFKLGQSLVRADEKLDEVQAQWAAIVEDLRRTGLTTQNADEYTERTAGVNALIRDFFSALFLRSAQPSFNDLSNVWQLATGLRTLLDLTGRGTAVVCVEAGDEKRYFG